MNRPLLIGLILAALLAFILFTNQSEPSPSTAGQTAQQKVRNKTAQLQNAEAPKAAILPTSDPLPLVGMKAAKYVPDLAALAHFREDLPFKFIGNDAVGRVLDRQGRVLIESGKEIGIMGVAVAPDKQLVLVKGGDAINFVLDPATGQKIKLPVYPPGANMLGFGSWNWIGPRTLLGESGVQAFNAKGWPMNCCEGHNVAQTKLYSFDVTTQRLAEVTIPSEVKQPVVNVMEVSSDGHVHLAHEEPHGGAEHDFGWFKIDAPK